MEVEEEGYSKRKVEDRVISAQNQLILAVRKYRSNVNNTRKITESLILSASISGHLLELMVMQ